MGRMELCWFLLVVEVTWRRWATAASPTCCHQQLKSKFQMWSDTRLSPCTSQLTGSGFLLQTGHRRRSWEPETHGYIPTGPERITMSSHLHEVSTQREAEQQPASVPVSTLNSHRHAVVQLQPGDVAEAQHDACSIRPADALRQPLEVGLGALP